MGYSPPITGIGIGLLRSKSPWGLRLPGLGVKVYLYTGLKVLSGFYKKEVYVIIDIVLTGSLDYFYFLLLKPIPSSLYCFRLYTLVTLVLLRSNLSRQGMQMA